MNTLERPAQFPGREVERDDRAREALDRRAAVRAELVGRQVAEREVDDAELLVDARRRPRIRRVGRIRLAGSEAGGRVWLAEIPAPDQVSVGDVEGADHARGVVDRFVVVDRAADDDEVLRHHRRRGLHVIARLELADIDGQVDDAVLAEAGAGLAGRGVEREQSSVDARQDDPLQARRSGRRRHASRGAARRGRRGGGRCDAGWRGGATACSRREGRVVIGEAATVEVLEVVTDLDLRIELPPLLAGRRVERDHVIVLGAEVEHVADLERHVLGGRLVRIVRAFLVAGVKGPGELEIADVARRDVCERRVPLARGGASVDRPVVSRSRRCDRRGAGRDRPVHLAGDVEGISGHRYEADDEDEERGRAEPGARREPVRPGPAANGSGGDGGRRPCGGGRVDPAARCPERERPAHPRCQQPEADKPEERQARRERPAVEAGLEQRPRERESEERGVDPECDMAARDQKCARQQPADAEHDIGPGAAKRRQPDATARQYHAQHQHHPPGHHRSHEVLQQLLFALTGKRRARSIAFISQYDVPKSARESLHQTRHRRRCASAPDDPVSVRRRRRARARSVAAIATVPVPSRACRSRRG